MFGSFSARFYSLLTSSPDSPWTSFLILLVHTNKLSSVFVLRCSVIAFLVDLLRHSWFLSLIHATFTRVSANNEIGSNHTRKVRLSVAKSCDISIWNPIVHKSSFVFTDGVHLSQCVIDENWLGLSWDGSWTVVCTWGLQLRISCSYLTSLVRPVFSFAYYLLTWSSVLHAGLLIYL